MDVYALIACFFIIFTLIIIVGIVFWKNQQTKVFPVDYIVNINVSAGNGSVMY